MVRQDLTITGRTNGGVTGYMHYLAIRIKAA